MKPFLLSFLLFLATTSASADGFAVGFLNGMNLDGKAYQAVNPALKSQLTIIETNVLLGTFVDLTWLEARLIYSSQAGSGRWKFVDTPGSSNEKQVQSTLSSWNYRLAGKIPILLGRVTVFPLVGVEYDQNLEYQTDGSTSHDYPDQMHDVLLVAGMGIDWKLLDAFFLRHEIHASLNLTPNAYGFEELLSSTYQFTQAGLRFGVELALGYAF